MRPLDVSFRHRERERVYRVYQVYEARRLTRTRGALRKRLLSPRRSSLIQRVKGIHLDDENSFSSERTVEASKQAKTTATRPKAKSALLSHGSSSRRGLPEEDRFRERKRARKECETSRRRATNVLGTVSLQEHATSASLRSAGRRATRSPTSRSDAGSLRRQPCNDDALFRFFVPFRFLRSLRSLHFLRFLVFFASSRFGFSVDILHVGNVFPTCRNAPTGQGPLVGCRCRM